MSRFDHYDLWAEWTFLSTFESNKLFWAKWPLLSTKSFFEPIIYFFLAKLAFFSQMSFFKHFWTLLKRMNNFETFWVQ